MTQFNLQQLVNAKSSKPSAYQFDVDLAKGTCVIRIDLTKLAECEPNANGNLVLHGQDKHGALLLQCNAIVLAGK